MPSGSAALRRVRVLRVLQRPRRVVSLLQQARVRQRGSQVPGSLRRVLQQQLPAASLQVRRREALQELAPRLRWVRPVLQVLQLRRLAAPLLLRERELERQPESQEPVPQRPARQARALQQPLRAALLLPQEPVGLRLERQSQTVRARTSWLFSRLGHTPSVRRRAPTR